jgi:hypothetical protein
MVAVTSAGFAKKVEILIHTRLQPGDRDGGEGETV